MESQCPKCHAAVKETDYFCFNCGTKFRDPPPSTTISTQILYYIGSLVLPPLGIFWSIKYFKQPDEKSKTMGAVMIALTIVSLIVTYFFTEKIFSMIQNQIGAYTGGLGGF
jgi:hypothetical protein